MNIMLTEEDKSQFCSACEQIIGQQRERMGIGTLSEKTVHAVLKRYLVPNENYHEIKCEGYVADILYEGEITEIQTAGFNKLRSKLEAFLPLYDVTVVYPIPHIKWMHWIDESTGEVTEKRKSPKKGSYYQAFYELYKIKMYLKNPRLHFRLILLDVEEYRMLNGWSQDKKRGSTRYDRIPVDIFEDKILNMPEDFAELVPETLADEFTAKDFAKAARLSPRQTGCAVNVLSYLDVIRQTDKRGNAFVYKRTKDIG